MTAEYVFKTLSEGFWATLEIFAWTVVLATAAGLLITLLNYTKIKLLTWFVQTFVWIIRGTPLMLQLIIVYYGLALSGISIGMMTAAVLTFSVNYAVYFSEIFRGAINSVPKGQREACRVLGLSAFSSFVFVILPQAFKQSLPPLNNEWQTLAKDTALARVIGIIELTRTAQNLVSASTFIYPLLLTGVFYLALNSVITLLFKLLERKLKYYSV